MLPIPTLSAWNKIMKLKLNVFPRSIWLGDKVVKLRARTWMAWKVSLYLRKPPCAGSNTRDNQTIWDVCNAMLPLCCWRLALHFDKQMMYMYAVEEAKSSTASACPSSWYMYINAILNYHRWCHGCAEMLKLPDHSSSASSRWWSATMRVAWSLTAILSSNRMTRHARRGQKRPRNLRTIQIWNWECLSRRLYRHHHTRDQESSDILCLLRFAGILFQQHYLLQFGCCGGHRDHGTGLWADHTLIHHQFLCWKRFPQHNMGGPLICIWLPGTDVHILLLARESWGQLGDHTHLKLLTGKGIQYHRVDVVERVRVVGRHKCWRFTGLHNLSIVDWTRTFVDITKTTWVGAYMKFYDDDSVTNCSYTLVTILIPIKLVNGNCHIRSRVQSSLSAPQHVPQTLTVTGSR